MLSDFTLVQWAAFVPFMLLLLPFTVVADVLAWREIPKEWRRTKGTFRYISDEEQKANDIAGRI